MRLLLLLALLPACVGPSGDAKETGEADADTDADTDTDTDTDTDGCPLAVVTPDSLEWTDLQLGFSAAGTVSVVNNCAGATALSVIPSVTGDGAFWIDDTPLSMAPGEVGTIEVAVTPYDYAGETATLVLTTNDPDAPTVEVPLTATVDADLDDDGFDTVDAGGTDCDDADAAIHPDSAEVFYDGVDQNCDGASDYDADADGHDALEHGGADCDDADATVNPGATESWYDGLDQDCDGADDYDADADGSRAPEGGGEDCDDADALVFPGAEDAWYDGVDADCDGGSDFDQDADGFDATDHGGADCDDLVASTNPDAAETWYDGVDADCDGGSDYDQDADGADATAYGGGDCADTDPIIGPAAAEAWYDGVDQDCDGASDYDADGDGYDATPYGGADCDDLVATISPAASEAWYDGLDQDCDGASDYDQDGDGVDSDAYGGADCDDLLSSVSPAAAETWYDGVDQDCDGASDYDRDGDGHDSDAWGGADCLDTSAAVNPDAAETWYDGIDGDCDGGSDYDQDGDGIDRFPEGTDCADTDAGSTAGTTETLNGVDDDCDGQTDEGFASPGDVVITEVMPNPAAVSDTVGEWFEVYNTTAYDVDLAGWLVYSDDGQSMTLGSVVVPAGGYAVLGVEDDTTRNGSVPVDYQYSRASFALSDAGDSLYLATGSDTIAEVSWGGSWPFASGSAMQLDPDHFDYVDGSDEAYWCAATDSFGSGDLGTPGAENADCSSLDDDGDGYSTTDCDDDDADSHWGAAESADGVDENCNLWVDDELATSATVPYARGASSSDNVTFGGLGDFDGDGTPELVIADSSASSGTHGIYLLDGGSFTGWAGSYADYDEASFSPSSAGERFSNAAYGPPTDLTGDGVDDLVYANNHDSNNPGFVVFAGPITGTTSGLAPDLVFRNTEGSSSLGETVTVGSDLDGDGLSEAIFAYAASSYGGTSLAGTVSILTQADLAAGTADYGDATLNLVGSSDTGFLGLSSAVGDLDGDGYDDLVASGMTSDRTYVWLSDGLATTGTQALSTIAPLSIRGTYGGGHFYGSLPDVNADGQLDLALSDSYNYVYLYEGVGGRAGTLTAADADATFDASISSSSSWNDYAGVLHAVPDTDGDGFGEMGVWSNIYDYSDTTLGFFGAGAASDGALTESDAVFAANIGRSLYWSYTPSVRDGDVDGDGTDELVVFSRYLTLGTSTYYEGGVLVIEP